MIADALLAMSGVLGRGVLLVAAVLLVAESGLLIGVILPGISVTIGLGVLAGTGVVPASAGCAAAIAAAVAGPSLGYWRARRRGTPASGVDGRVPGPARRILRLAEARPTVAVLIGQWFAVARTLVPRLAGHTLTYPRFVTLSVPVATGWAVATFGLGRLLVTGSTAAARAVSAQQVLANLVLAALAVVLLWTAVRSFRHRGHRSAGPGVSGPRRRREP